MKNNDSRIALIRTFEKDMFLHNAGTVLRESHADGETDSSEHDRLFKAFHDRATELFGNNPQGADRYLIRYLAMAVGTKKDSTAVCKTLREQLQGQITASCIRDLDGPLSVETLWALICINSPHLKKYRLDGPYEGESDTDLMAAIVCTASSIAIRNSQASYL